MSGYVCVKSVRPHAELDKRPSMLMHPDSHFPIISRSQAPVFNSYERRCHCFVPPSPVSHRIFSKMWSAQVSEQLPIRGLTTHVPDPTAAGVKAVTDTHCFPAFQPVLHSHHSWSVAWSWLLLGRASHIFSSWESVLPRPPQAVIPACMLRSP